MRNGSHTISQLQIHIVWVTKYRYPVLKGDIQKRCRDMITQICDAEDIWILKGVVSKDHVHMHIELDKERRSLMASWKRRQKLIDGVLQNTTEMYGSLQGIAGSSALGYIEALELLDEDG